VRVRVAKNSKHPDGAVWVEGDGGWMHLVGADAKLLIAGFGERVSRIEAELTVDRELVEELFASASDSVNMLPADAGCRTCDG
jgi:hypothetical protein